MTEDERNEWSQVIADGVVHALGRIAVFWFTVLFVLAAVIMTVFGFGALLRRLML